MWNVDASSPTLPSMILWLSYFLMKKKKKKAVCGTCEKLWGFWVLAWRSCQGLGVARLCLTLVTVPVWDDWRGRTLHHPAGPTAWPGGLWVTAGEGLEKNISWWDVLNWCTKMSRAEECCWLRWKFWESNTCKVMGRWDSRWWKYRETIVTFDKKDTGWNQIFYIL